MSRLFLFTALAVALFIGTCNAGTLDKDASCDETRVYQASCETLGKAVAQVAVASARSSEFVGTTFQHISFRDNHEVHLVEQGGDFAITATVAPSGSHCSLKVVGHVRRFFINPLGCYLWESSKLTDFLDALDGCSVPAVVDAAGTYFKDDCPYAQKDGVGGYACHETIAPSEGFDVCDTLTITPVSGTGRYRCEKGSNAWESQFACIDGVMRFSDGRTELMEVNPTASKAFAGVSFVCRGRAQPFTCAGGSPQFTQQDPSWPISNAQCNFGSSCPAISAVDEDCCWYCWC